MNVVKKAVHCKDMPEFHTGATVSLVVLPNAMEALWIHCSAQTYLGKMHYYGLDIIEIKFI